MSPRAEAPVPSTETLVPAKIQGFPSCWGPRPREQNLPSPPTHPAVPPSGTSRPRQKQLQSPRGPPFRSRGPKGRHEGISGMTRGDPRLRSTLPSSGSRRGEPSHEGTSGRVRRDRGFLSRGRQITQEGTGANARGDPRAVCRFSERSCSFDDGPCSSDGCCPSVDGDSCSSYGCRGDPDARDG